MKPSIAPDRHPLKPGGIVAAKCGFTLLETVIAMTLVSVLMLLVWSIFGIYTKLENKGVNAANRVSLIRSFHRQMRDDLVRLLPCDVDRSLPTANLQDGGFADDGIHNGYFSGDRQRICFAIVQRRSDAAGHVVRLVTYRPATAADLPGHDELLVSDDGGDVRGDEAMEIDAMEADTGLLEASSGRIQRLGIVRVVESWDSFLDSAELFEAIEGVDSGRRQLALDADDFMTIGPADLTDDSVEQEAERDRQLDMVPEIADCQFQFFDGQVWRSRWESSVRNGYPRALAVTVDVIESQDPETPDDGDVASDEVVIGPDDEWSNDQDVFASDSADPLVASQDVSVETEAEEGIVAALGDQPVRWVIALSQAATKTVDDSQQSVHPDANEWGDLP
ncbi:prepilin-type N-terminal cleavage/methylation domain-containing protein [Crateriforma conspicua]|uniref:Pseudopilin GspJ n=1 Tax=Crateriforma conspicua TaxID=2527996 RepID=A0A5C5Y3N1_9PLAN|nr:prepilin-type N-terminal cleavage/methylation domain-containing protein [Crateriforma conspicua]QDV64977.1 hypothetical protein Mal65_41460 [Crateriforma conspicua]TWT70376.1 hypothetical protein Pan14r_26820 [Crateriforma conspicua]